MMQRNVLIAGAVVIGMVSLGGCATKKFVMQSVGVVDTRVASVEGRVAVTDANLAGVDTTAKEPFWIENIGISASAKPGQSAPPVNESFAQIGTEVPEPTNMCPSRRAQ